MSCRECIFTIFENRDYEAAFKILEEDISVINLIDENSHQTPVFIPAASNDIELMRRLVESPFDKVINFHIRDVWGRNAYDVALDSGNYEICRLMVPVMMRNKKQCVEESRRYEIFREKVKSHSRQPS